MDLHCFNCHFSAELVSQRHWRASINTALLLPLPVSLWVWKERCLALVPRVCFTSLKLLSIIYIACTWVCTSSSCCMARCNVVAVSTGCVVSRLVVLRDGLWRAAPKWRILCQVGCDVSRRMPVTVFWPNLLHLFATVPALPTLNIYANVCSNGWQHNPGDRDDQCRDRPAALNILN